jgi:hypothetical protein
VAWVNALILVDMDYSVTRVAPLSVTSGELVSVTSAFAGTVGGGFEFERRARALDRPIIVSLRC